MEIQIPNNPQYSATLCNVNKGKIGTLDSIYKFYHIRTQISKHKLEGYYIVFVDDLGDVHEIHLDSNGRCDRWPEGFFDQCDKLLQILL